MRLRRAAALMLLAWAVMLVVALLPAPVAAIANPDAIAMHTLKMFQSVLVTGDWLAICSYDVGYAILPTETPQTAFLFQLLDASGGLLYSRPIYAYNYGATSIYLTPAQATALVWGSSYKYRIVGNPALFASLVEGTNQVTKTLSPVDWITGTVTTSPDLVKTHVLDIVAAMETHDSATYTTSVPYGKALTTTGRDKFVPNQIPNLYSITPSLFQGVVYDSGVSLTAGTGAYTTDLSMANQLGATMNTAFTGVGAYFGVSGQMVGAIVALFFASIVGSIVFLATGSGAGVVVFLIPMVIVGVWLGMIPMAVVFALAIVIAAYMGYELYLKGI